MKHMSATSYGSSGWIKSSRSNGSQACVEVRFDDEAVFIRDSKFRRNHQNDPACEPIIAVPRGQWQAFLDSVAGQPTGHSSVTICADRFGGTTLRAMDGVELTYTPAEWAAFRDGVFDGEFDRKLIAAA